MPLFVKRATVRVPAARSPVQAAPGRPVGDLFCESDAHAFCARVDQIRWACQDDSAAFEGSRARALAIIPASS
jgi:hypothetical protein